MNIVNVHIVVVLDIMLIESRTVIVCHGQDELELDGMDNKVVCKVVWHTVAVQDILRIVICQ